MMQEEDCSNNLDERERKEAKKRSEDSMNFMYGLQQQGTNCDFVIHTEDGGQFPTHSAIMCRCSPYFQALFIDENNKKDVCTLPGVDSATMRLIVQYSYTRKVAITLQNASDLMMGANHLNISTLVDQCGRFISKNLNAANYVEVYRFARKNVFDTLASNAHRCIMKEFRSVCNESKELLELNLDDFINLINRDELNVDNEAVVWETVVRWIDFDPEERVNHTAALMRSVRLGLMDPVYFREKVKDHPYVKQQEDRCRDIVIEAMMIPTLCQPRLPHDFIFAVGGQRGARATDTIEIYDIRSDRWINVHVENSPGPRAYHGCVVIGNEIYIIGGIDRQEHLNSCWCFHLGTLSWREISPMHCQRGYVSVAEVNGLMYAMGGCKGHRQSLNTAEVYIPSNNQWKFIAPMHMQRCDADATSCKGKIYIVGGCNGQTGLNSMECYDPGTKQWTMLASMSVLRSGLSCIAYRGCIYAVGGIYGETQFGTTRLRSVEKYDVSSGTWSQVEDMNRVRSNFGIEVLEDRIFVIGGYNDIDADNDVDDFALHDVEYYDASTGTWRECGPMHIHRWALSTCMVSGLDQFKSLSGFHSRLD